MKTLNYRRPHPQITLAFQNFLPANWVYISSISSVWPNSKSIKSDNRGVCGPICIFHQRGLRDLLTLINAPLNILIIFYPFWGQGVFRVIFKGLRSLNLTYQVLVIAGVAQNCAGIFAPIQVRYETLYVFFNFGWRIPVLII